MVVKEESGMITLQIQIQEAVTGHKILSLVTERSVPLRRVFLDFCDRLDLVYSTVRFLHEGKRLADRKTAKQCHLQDGDLIDANCDQIGGATAAGGPTTSTST